MLQAEYKYLSVRLKGKISLKRTQCDSCLGIMAGCKRGFLFCFKLSKENVMEAMGTCFDEADRNSSKEKRG